MVVFDLLIPQAIRGIVNNGILGGDFDWVVRGSLYMAVFAIASMIVRDGERVVRRSRRRGRSGTACASRSTAGSPRCRGATSTGSRRATSSSGSPPTSTRFAR